jgi:glycosyltransferase involved in cell wall biosynthesis
MKISVVVPTYKRTQDFIRALSSLQDQERSVDELIVVIGPGDTDTFIAIDNFEFNIKKVKILKAQKASLIHSLNLALTNVEGDIICLLDDDVWLPLDWSKKIEKAYQENKKMGAYGGRDHLQSEDLALANPSPAITVGTFLANGTASGNHHCGSVKSPLTVDVLKGVNLSFRKSAFTKLKIDTQLESKGAEICSEIDICQSIQKNNYSVIYDNDNYLLHFASPRPSYDNRDNFFQPIEKNRIFNKSYVYGKYRPLSEVILFAIRQILVGNRLQPGIAWSLILLKRTKKIKALVFPFELYKKMGEGFIKGRKIKNIV